MAKVRFYDPDFIVCHDANTVLDLIISRYNRLADRNRANKSRFSRLFNIKDYGAGLSQNQKISNSIAGRLLVDTFTHSKDMIK